jgi:hypothetical protein
LRDRQQGDGGGITVAMLQPYDPAGQHRLRQGLSGIPYDVAKAKQLLARSGMGRGLNPGDLGATSSRWHSHSGAVAGDRPEAGDRERRFRRLVGRHRQGDYDGANGGLKPDGSPFAGPCAARAVQFLQRLLFQSQGRRAGGTGTKGDRAKREITRRSEDHTEEVAQIPLITPRMQSPIQKRLRDQAAPSLQWTLEETTVAK